MPSPLTRHSSQFFFYFACIILSDSLWPVYTIFPGYAFFVRLHSTFLIPLVFPRRLWQFCLKEEASRFRCSKIINHYIGPLSRIELSAGKGKCDGLRSESEIRIVDIRGWTVTSSSLTARISSIPSSYGPSMPELPPSSDMPTERTRSRSMDTGCVLIVPALVITKASNGIWVPPKPGQPIDVRGM